MGVELEVWVWVGTRTEGMLVEDLVVLMLDMVMDVCMGVGSGWGISSVGSGDDPDGQVRCCCCCCFEVGTEAVAMIGVAVLGASTP